MILRKVLIIMTYKIFSVFFSTHWRKWASIELGLGVALTEKGEPVAFGSSALTQGAMPKSIKNAWPLSLAWKNSISIHMARKWQYRVTIINLINMVYLLRAHRCLPHNRLTDLLIAWSQLTSKVNGCFGLNLWDNHTPSLTYKREKRWEINVAFGHKNPWK